tara:strand:+ start:13562 stop:20239 length:6678 start_codon:yes stop_codon:yes gene_type:complete
MTNILFVPITLDALVANREISIAKQGANFSEMPYQDSNFIDLQTDTANLASSIRYEPFNNVGSLKKGVHLHWALPDALTQGEVQEASGSESLRMPTVPNRWLIIKRNSDDSITEQWIVESDYLHPKGSSPERAVCIPIEPEKLAKGNPPFRHLGRQTKVTDLVNWSEDATADRYENLNVLGWGNPYFSALYDQCFSVFGCYDSSSNSIASVKGCSYEVIGWYADSTKDYIKESILKEVNKAGNTKNFSQLAKEIANWDLNNDLIIQHKVYKALKQTSPEDFTDTTAWEEVSFNEIQANTDYKKDDHTIVSDQGKLYQVIEDVITSENPVGSLAAASSWQEVPLVESGELYKVGVIIRTNDWEADQILCYGRLHFDASASLEDGINAEDAQLALASTGTEAVSTYLSKQIRNDQNEELQEDEQLRIENQLEAVILKDAVQGKNVDFINRLKSDRHKQGFSQVDGGSLWAFIEENRILIAQQTLFPDTYDTSSKTLYIAGKKWVFTMATAHENDFDNHTLDLAYSLNDGASPVVRIENNTFIVQLGDINSPNIVGQLKAILESNEVITRVKIIDNLDAEIVPDNYDAANKTLYIAGKKMVLTMATGHEDDLTSHTPTITYDAPDGNNPVVQVNDDKTLTIQLGEVSTPSSLNELKIVLEKDYKIEIAKIIGDEARYTNFTKALKNLKNEQSDELQQLNQDQFRQNQLEFVIEHQREMLYSDWSKYMLCLYPVDRLNDTAYPDSDLIKHFIEHQSLSSLRLLQSNKEQIAQNISTQLSDMRAELENVLTHYDTKASQDQALVKKIPASRFWEPNEPSLLISGNVAQPSDRHGEDGTLLCVGTTLTDDSPNKMVEVTESLPEYWKTSVTRLWERQPWNPILMEWDVALYPDHQSVRQNENQLQPYHPDFIKQSYRIPLNDAEYSLPSASVDMKPRIASFKTSVQPSIIKGNSLLTGGIRQVVVKELQAYLDEKLEEKGQADFDDHLQSADFADPIYTIHKALEELTKVNCLSQQLDGLYDEYLMQSSGLRLPIEDPHRFIIEAAEASADTSFTAKVKEALGDGFFKLPATGNRFLPIRSGITKLNQVRIVDTFGRYKDLSCESLLRPQRQLVGSSWYLPPRLVQPARLNVRWHMLPHQQLLGMNFKGRTPVCGWLLYNYFDETLVIYNTVGVYIGAINSDGEWQDEDGINFANTQNISDPTLQKFVDKLRSFHPEYRPKPNSGNNYLSQLKQAIRRGQENTNPETNNSNQSTLRSQPLAIVRASLDLQLKGLPQANKSWRALNHDMNADGIDRSCREFTAVKFPVKLGEYRNLDDGLICYWTQNHQGALSQTGYFPQSDVQDIEGLIDAADFNPDEHDYIDAIKKEGVDNLHHCLEEPPLDLVILMDPEAPIHATMGIVPRKVLRLEPTMYKDALDAIDISYFAAPLLTPRIPSQEYALPLPSGAWQWKQPHYGGHSVPKVSLDGAMQKLQLRLGIFKAPTKLKQLRTALEAMEEITSVTVESDLEDDVLYPNTYSSTSKQLTLAGKQLTLIFGDGYQDVLYNHTPNVTYLLESGNPRVRVLEDILTFTLGANDLTTVKQLKEMLEANDRITSATTTETLEDFLIQDTYKNKSKELCIAGKKLQLTLNNSNTLDDYYLNLAYNLGATPNVNITAEGTLIITLGDDFTATTVGQLKKVLEAENAHIESVTTTENLHSLVKDVSISASYDVDTNLLTVGDKEFTVTPTDGITLTVDPAQIQFTGSVTSDTPMISIENNTLTIQLKSEEIHCTVGELKTALEANSTISIATIIKGSSADSLKPDTYHSDTLTIAGKSFTLQWEDSNMPSTHIPAVSYSLQGATPTIDITNGTYHLNLGKIETATTVQQLKTAFEDRTDIESVETIENLDDTLLPNSFHTYKVLIVSGKKFTIVLYPLHQDKLGEGTTPTINYSNMTSDPSNISIHDDSFTIDLGAPSSSPSTVAKLKTALEEKAEIYSVEIDDDPDELMVLNFYDDQTEELTIRGKKFTLTLAEEYQGDLITHTPEINTLSERPTTPTLAIENQTFSITFGDLATPATVGQLKEVLEEKAEITSVQTLHDASEELIPDQLSHQEMKLYLSGKELPLTPKGDTLQDHTLEVKYSEVGTLALPGVTVVDKQVFLINEGNETEWETLHTLEILRSDPEKPNIAYYYPPSQDPDETKISDWSFIREALEKSQRPSLSPLNQIGPCELRVEAVEGYFRKIKLPDEYV